MHVYVCVYVPVFWWREYVLWGKMRAGQSIIVILATQKEKIVQLTYICLQKRTFLRQTDQILVSLTNYFFQCVVIFPAGMGGEGDYSLTAATRYMYISLDNSSRTITLTERSLVAS